MEDPSENIDTSETFCFLPSNLETFFNATLIFCKLIPASRNLFTSFTKTISLKEYNL